MPYYDPFQSAHEPPEYEPGGDTPDEPATPPDPLEHLTRDERLERARRLNDPILAKRRGRAESASGARQTASKPCPASLTPKAPEAFQRRPTPSYARTSASDERSEICTSGASDNDEDRSESLYGSNKNTHTVMYNDSDRAGPRGIPDQVMYSRDGGNPPFVATSPYNDSDLSSRSDLPYNDSDHEADDDVNCVGEHVATIDIAAATLARAKARFEAEIQDEARRHVPPAYQIINPTWQFFDNRERNKSQEQAWADAGETRKDGQPKRCTRSAFTLKLSFKTARADGSLAHNDRFINFQKPKKFSAEFKLFTIHRDYNEEMYQQTRLALSTKHGDMIGHFEKYLSAIKTKKHKSGLEKGSARLPYSFATLQWQNGYPLITTVNGYEMRQFRMEYKQGGGGERCPDFEFYGLGDLK